MDGARKHGRYLCILALTIACVGGCSVFGARERLEEAESKHDATSQEVALARTGVEEAEARDQAWLGLGETAATIIGTFLPTAGIIGTIGLSAVRRGRTSGIQGGASAIIEGIAEARRTDPGFDKAFDELSPQAKRAIELAIGNALPQALDILKTAKRK